MITDGSEVLVGTFVRAFDAPPRLTRSVRFRRVDLDEAFPITADPDSLQDDHPIRHLHQHQCAEIGLCLEGSGVFVVGEKVLEFSAGDVTFISHNEVHLARSMPGTSSRWHWIYLDPLRLTGASPVEHFLLDPVAMSGPRFNNVIRPQEAPHLPGIASRIVDEIRDRNIGYATTLMSLTAEFMVLLRRARPVDVLHASRNDGAAGIERIAPAISLVARSFAEPLSVEQLARACSMSQPTLRRAFSTAMGCTPREYWTSVRLQMATSMLRSTSKTIAEISTAVGFTTLSSFNHLFLERFGTTPRAWRHNAMAPEQADTAATQPGSTGPLSLRG